MESPAPIFDATAAKLLTLALCDEGNEGQSALSALRRHVVARGLHPSDLLIVAYRGGRHRDYELLERFHKLADDAERRAEQAERRAEFAEQAAYDHRGRIEEAERLCRDIAKLAKAAKTILRG